MLLTSGFPGKPAIWHMQDRPLEERLRLHGRGYIDPLDPVVAGDYLTVAFHFEAGECEIPTGGRLRIVWLWPYDWADLQTDNPGGAGYMSVATTTRAGAEAPSVCAAYHRRGDLVPWNHEIELTLTRDRLCQGDRLRLVCGDRSGGGRGWRAPTFAARAAEFLLLINPDGADRLSIHSYLFIS